MTTYDKTQGIKFFQASAIVQGAVIIVPAVLTVVGKDLSDPEKFISAFGMTLVAFNILFWMIAILKEFFSLVFRASFWTLSMATMILFSMASYGSSSSHLEFAINVIASLLTIILIVGNVIAGKKLLEKEEVSPRKKKAAQGRV